MNANIFPLFSAPWLVDDSVAVSLRHVWTREWMLSFWHFVQVVLLFFILMSILSSHGCYMCTTGHPHISSHGPLKTSSHFAVHIHVSPILTRLRCGKLSEAVPSFSVEWVPFPPPPPLPPSPSSSPAPHTGPRSHFSFPKSKNGPLGSVLFLSVPQMVETQSKDEGKSPC